MVIERRFNGSVNFETLNIGDCFDFNGSTYIKMGAIETHEYSNKCILHNAFYVNKSITYHFSGKEKVFPIKMKFVEV